MSGSEDASSAARNHALSEHCIGGARAAASSKLWIIGLDEAFMRLKVEPLFSIRILVTLPNFYPVGLESGSCWHLTQIKPRAKARGHWRALRLGPLAVSRLRRRPRAQASRCWNAAEPGLSRCRRRLGFAAHGRSSSSRANLRPESEVPATAARHSVQPSNTARRRKRRPC